ncbi:MAG: flagellar biosynthetic protein FliO [Xanthobacteraceae bacterium]
MFGDMPRPAKFLIAFVIVLALIGGVAWLVRRFGAGRMSPSSARGRQARLGVIEATAVDNRRRLVLVRRDNVEHLIMLGGPTDVVVEANIIRAQAAGREAPAPGWSPPVDAGAWPGAPEPALRAGRGAERPTVPAPVTDDLPLQPYPEPAPRVQAGERFSHLTSEFGRSGGRAEPPSPRAPAESPKSPAEARRPFAPTPRASEEAQASDRHLAAMAQQLEAALRRPGPTTPARESAPVEPPAARRFGGEAPREPRFSLMERALQSRSFTSPRAKAPTPPPAPEAPPVHTEAAEGDASAPASAPTSAPEEPTPAQSAAPPAEPTEEAKNQSTDAPAETNEAAESKPASLEEEMANLLGRSPGKP